MRVSILDTLTQVYARTFADFRKLAKVSLLWFALTLIGETMRQSAGVTATTVGASADLSLILLLGTVLHLLAVLSGWFFSHTVMYKPEQKVSLWPDRLQLKFIGVQSLNLIVLGMLSGLIISLVGLLWLNQLSQQTQAELMAGGQRASYIGLPLVLLFFSRLLLMAPMMVRGLPKTLKSSWVATEGQTFRLFVLQIGCLMPIVLTESVASLLRGLSVPSIVPVVVSVIGTYIGLWLLTRLAEDEYKRLAPASKASSPEKTKKKKR